MILAPSNQTSLYGHNNFFKQLVNLYSQKKLPNRILLSGEKGIGKSTLSYHLINYILSIDEDYIYDINSMKINPNNKSFLLTQNKTNPNFYLIDLIEGKKKIDINQIRNLILNLNKSSFNNKPKFVLIDNIELLNVNSINALLKILEDPNENIIFILINNDKNILPTLKSRCLNFKILLNYKDSISIINKILKDDIHEYLNKEFISNYSTPGYLLRLFNFSKDFNVDLKNKSLKDIILLIIKEKYFKKDTALKEMSYYLIELYFRSTISIKNIELINFYNIFVKKVNNTKNFNLDDESLFMEFENKVLNG